MYDMNMFGFDFFCCCWRLYQSTNCKIVVWGPVVWDSKGYPLSNNPYGNPFHMQTSNPNHQSGQIIARFWLWPSSGNLVIRFGVT